MVKMPVFTRPLPQSGVEQFSQFMVSHSWDEVLAEQDLDKKVEKFHQTLRQKLDECLPEKKCASLILRPEMDEPPAQ